ATPSVGAIAAQRRFADHSLFLITSATYVGAFGDLCGLVGAKLSELLTNW
ncbi:hypothetical protein A2U01_0062820, partial [Trifolium medium]|nr:hypothetical protein [Trifolium medium]